MITPSERRTTPPIEAYVTTEEGIRLFAQALGNGLRAVVIPNGFHLLDDFKYLAADRTLVAYDLRNRGLSDHVSDSSRLKRGIHHDVDDLEAIHAHFGFAKMSVIGHSYPGLTAILYAMKYPAHVDRVVQVGAPPPDHAKKYPPHLSGHDATLLEVLAQLARLQANRGSDDPEEFCRKVWSVLRLIYVTNPADADRINWGRCHLPNERNALKYWNQHVLPSIQRLSLTAEDVATVTMPVLTIHGTRDRSAPYGGGREWALLLPDARLVTVENAGHAPWIEAPEIVFNSIRAFLDGTWPAAAQSVESV